MAFLYNIRIGNLHNLVYNQVYNTQKVDNQNLLYMQAKIMLQYKKRIKEYN